MNQYNYGMVFNKTLIIITGTSSGIGSQLKSILTKDKKFETQVFHSRDISENYTDDITNKHIYGDLENYSNEWFSAIDLGRFSNIIFVNNAATIEPIDKFKNLSVSSLNKSLSINTLFTAKITQFLANKKNDNAKFLIFNISSGASLSPVDGWTAYCMTKAATKMMLDVIDLENKDISVVHYDPGIVDTNMQKTIRSSNKKSMKDLSYFKTVKLKNSSEVAGSIIDLIIEASSSLSK
jgi:benzil reductase ((S)-benzoin forming)